MADKNETYYAILRVDPGATIAEIVAAYHSARAAFSKDSVATYSLFSSDDTEQVLNKLEEAYLTLSNVEKKRDYDKKLGGAHFNPLVNHSHEAGEEVLSMPTYDQNTLETTQEPATTTATETSPEATDPRLHLPQNINGAFLKEMRQKRSLSIEDVSRITKIPAKFLRTLEEDEDKNMPARVYVQGFIKNLATLYKLDPQTTAKSFLSNLDEKKQAH